jgi:hypothetical protein
VTENLRMIKMNWNGPFAGVVNQGIVDDGEPATVQEIATNGCSTPALAS